MVAHLNDLRLGHLQPSLGLAQDLLGTAARRRLLDGPRARLLEQRGDHLVLRLLLLRFATHLLQALLQAALQAANVLLRVSKTEMSSRLAPCHATVRDTWDARSSEAWSAMVFFSD